MKILHIISSAASGGAEIMVRDLSAEMVRQGHEVHVGFLDRAIEAGRDINFENNFLSQLDVAGVKHFHIGAIARKRPWLGWWRLRRYVRKYDIDVVHTHMAFGVFFSFLLNSLIVFTRHGHERRWNKTVYFLMNRLVDRYVAVSKASATDLATYTGREVIAIENGVSLSKFREFHRVRDLADDGVIKIAMIGRLVAEKDYPTAIEAVALLPFDLKKKLKIKVAGEEARKGRLVYLQSLAKQAGVSENFDFCGLVEDIPSFLYDADLFLMSSVTEGLPISLLEATASGLPCVVTDVGGCRGVLDDCQNGYAVDPGNSYALAAALKLVLQEREGFKGLSENALNNARKYSLSECVARHIDLYEGGVL